MGNYRASVGTQQTAGLIEPSGISGIKVSVERESEKAFFRRKSSGSVEFSNDLFNSIKPLEGVCCLAVPFAVYRTCGGSGLTKYLDAQFKTNEIEWDFEVGVAKVDNIEIIDSYKGVYKYWEKKINLCTAPRGKRLKYTYRKPSIITQGGKDVTLNAYPEVVNDRGSLFSEWILWAVNKTFYGTDYSSLIPISVSQMSQFFDRNISPITAKQNVLRSAFIYQASDLMFPETSSASTGVLEDGRINEDVALSLKEVLEFLKLVFDIDWYIDTNGKFRVEHSSYFANGLSYTTGNDSISIDLRQERYLKHLYGYKYSYKPDTGNLFGLEELRLNSNEAIGKSKNITDPNGTNAVTEQGAYYYSFSRIDDFEYGNIKYIADCVSLDDKGQPRKNVRSSDVIITNFEAVRMADETVDATKWVLLDVSEEPQIGEIGVLPQFQNYLVKSAVCERTTLSVSNGRLSATAIMRDFHRYNRPFASGLMNYNDTPNGLIGKGYVREMYSLVKTKRLKRISVPFCCSDPAFNPYFPVILPNGTKATVLKAEFDFSSETLNIDTLQDSACGYEVKFPVELGGEYPPKGKILSVIDISDACLVNRMVYDTQGVEIGCSGFMQPITGVRTVYADGEGGSYFTDVLDYSECVNDPSC